MLDRSLKVAIFASACLGLGMVSAHADGWITTRSGAESVEMLDTTPEIYYDPNGAYIDSALHANFICPVEAHFFSLNGGGQFTNVLWWAFVDDNHPSLDVSCFLQTCDDSGNCND